MRGERAYWGQSFFCMDDPRQYREFAAQCDHLAAQAKTEQHRKILKEMAATWRKLADEAEKRGH
jgi:hypothetical protein